MKTYYRLNEDNIVIEVISSNGVYDLPSTEDENCACGKHWNGSTFEDVPTEEVEVPETTEVTNADLLEVLLAIGEKVGA